MSSIMDKKEYHKILEAVEPCENKKISKTIEELKELVIELCNKGLLEKEYENSTKDAKFLVGLPNVYDIKNSIWTQEILLGDTLENTKVLEEKIAHHLQKKEVTKRENVATTAGEWRKEEPYFEARKQEEGKIENIETLEEFEQNYFKNHKEKLLTMKRDITFLLLLNEIKNEEDITFLSLLNKTKNKEDITFLSSSDKTKSEKYITHLLWLNEIKNREEYIDRIKKYIGEFSYENGDIVINENFQHKCKAEVF